MKLRRSLYAPPVVVGGQQCAKAPPDGGVSPSTAWSRRWPARGRVVACGPVPAADHPRSAYPAELLGGVPGVGVAVVRQAELSAAPSAAGPLSTVGVHPVQILVRSGVQPSGVQPSGCPTVRCPTVGVSNRRVSGHLAPSSRTDLSGRLVPPVRRSAVWCPPVSPVASVPSRVSPPWPLGVRRSGRGLRGWSGSGSGWPSGSVDGCGGLDAGDPAEVMGRPGGGERRSRTWPGRARAEAAALDR
jgi:hypothetical protein